MNAPIARPLTIAVCNLACLLILHSPVVAAVIRVRANDVNALVAAINSANSNGESFNDIVLPPGSVYSLKQKDNDTDGPNGLPSITSVLTISTETPVGALGPAIIEGPKIGFRIFHVSSGALGLRNIVVRGGGDGAIEGGALFNRGPITVLVNSVVRDSLAQRGGGIFNSANDGVRPGVLVLAAASQVTGNAALSGGGGIYTQGSLLTRDSTISLNTNETFGGGGIKTLGSASLENSTVNDNKSGAGGGTGGAGIYNFGTLTLANSTISGNKNDSGNGRGGGINNAGTLILDSVTITNNTTQLEGGGVNSAEFGTANLRNTIIAANFLSNRQSSDCRGTFVSAGFNLIGDTGLLRGTTTTPACTLTNGANDQIGTDSRPIRPGLEPFLKFNGGFTETHALLPNSPAIDHGPTDCFATDQRRLQRPADGNADGTSICDIGAFEFNAVPAVPRTTPAKTTITKDTKLDRDQTQGIVIGADNIVLDCNGHKITGGRIGPGIELNVRRGVTVRNCVVTNFNNGFNVTDSVLNIFVGNIVTDNQNDGFHIVSSDGNTFDDNMVEHNGDDGFDLAEATANFFRSNIVQRNANKGFTLDVSSGNFFVGNAVNDNGDSGFQVAFASRNNPFAGNRACNNGNVDFEEKSNPNFFRDPVGQFCRASGIRPGEEF